MVLEFIQGGEVYRVMAESPGGRLNLSLARFYVASVVAAFNYLGSLSIIYRDLKPENLLLTAEGSLKVIDFGFCKVCALHHASYVRAQYPRFADTARCDLSCCFSHIRARLPRLLQVLEMGKTFTFCGTPDYMAPEVICHCGYGVPADWWCVGVLLYEMLVGVPPFEPDGPSIDTFGMILNFARGAASMQWPSSGLIPKDAQALILALCTADVRKRLRTAEAKAHPFFGGMDFMALEKGRIPAPWKPLIKGGPTDTSQFDEISKEEEAFPEDEASRPPSGKGSVAHGRGSRADRALMQPGQGLPPPASFGNFELMADLLQQAVHQQAAEVQSRKSADGSTQLFQSGSVAASGGTASQNANGRDGKEEVEEEGGNGGGGCCTVQ